MSLFVFKKSVFRVFLYFILPGKAACMYKETGFNQDISVNQLQLSGFVVACVYGQLSQESVLYRCS